MATEVTMPRLSDSMEEGTILKWLVAEGDTVEEGAPLVEVETDKATVVHEALNAGVVLALSVAEGASVPVGAPILVLGEPGEALPQHGPPDGSTTGSALPTSEPPAVTPDGADGRQTAVVAAGGSPLALGSATRRVRASPLARRLAAQAGVDLLSLVGDEAQGRITRADVERALVSASATDTHTAPIGAAAARRASPEAVGSPLGVDAGRDGVGAKGTTTVEDLSGVQRTIARRMAESRAAVPDIELRVEVDMSAVVALREGLRGVSDPLPSVNDIVVKACATALGAFPRVNGAYRDGHFELFSRVNVGIAVAADNALLVPTVTDADKRSLGAIAHETRRLAARVRDGSITPAELTGGTFTVSNLGMFGVDSFCAIVNEPQAAILAVGSLKPRAVVDEAGAPVARETATLSLCCDHRILYGSDGARFLARVRELLERPLALLAA